MAALQNPSLSLIQNALMGSPSRQLRTHGMKALLSLSALLAPVLLGGVAHAQSGGKIVIKPGKIITLQEAPADAEDGGKSHGVIEGGTIVIDGGRIVAVGKDIAIPWDAELLEYPELTAFPGWVEAHTSRGMDRPNENIDVAPFLDVRDSIDPVNFYFEDSKRHGITTINIQHGNSCVVGAQGAVVKPDGMTVAQMMVRPDSGVKVGASAQGGKSQATQTQTLRQAFSDLRMELEKLVQEKKDGDDRARREALYQGRDYEGEDAEGKAMKGNAWKVEGLETVPRVEIDEKMRPLLAIVEGDIPVYMAAMNPMAVHTAIDIAKENGFLENTTLVLGESCWKAAAAIKEAGVPVVLSAELMHVERDPVTGEEVETFVPGVFAKHGIPFALTSRNQAANSLAFQVALCVGQGMKRDEAIAAATKVPAKMLGLEKRVGALAPGMDGNVVLYSGDPLSIASHVEYVVLEGNLVYDRAADIRNKFLLEGVAPPNTSPPDAAQVNTDIHAEEAKAGSSNSKKNEETEGDDQ